MFKLYTIDELNELSSESKINFITDKLKALHNTKVEIKKIPIKKVPINKASILTNHEQKYDLLIFGQNRLISHKVLNEIYFYLQ